MNLTRKGKYILIAINFLLIVLLIGYNKLNPAFRKTVSHRIAMTEYAAPGSKVAKKIFFKENQNYHSAKFQISLKFFPELDVYDNVFQLGAEPTTFRVELSPPNTLSAVIGYQNANLVEIYKIKDNLSLNTWHCKLPTFRTVLN